MQKEALAMWEEELRLKSEEGGGKGEGASNQIVYIQGRALLFLRTSSFFLKKPLEALGYGVYLLLQGNHTHLPLAQGSHSLPQACIGLLLGPPLAICPTPSKSKLHTQAIANPLHEEARFVCKQDLLVALS